MEIKYGLISCDSHAQPHKNAFLDRMSKQKWGDKIPQLMETSDKANMAVPYDRTVERWYVNGELVGNRGVVNCPTVMDDPMRKYFTPDLGGSPRQGVRSGGSAQGIG